MLISCLGISIKSDSKGVVMLNDEILSRLNHLKSNVRYFWKKLSDINLAKARKKISEIPYMMSEKIQMIKGYRVVKPKDIHIDNYHYESHRMDDLPLTLNKDRGPGIRYSYTENSEFARGAEKEEAIGIDSFGEEDTFDPEEIDEHQTFRDRKQNSDLSERFYTHGGH
jgi:hypothetical protein